MSMLCPKSEVIEKFEVTWVSIKTSEIEDLLQ